MLLVGAPASAKGEAPKCLGSKGLTDCGGQCVNLKTDANNCGSCGQACLDGQTCMAGSCIGSTNTKDCDDGNPCTNDAWVKGTCVSTPKDTDGDGTPDCNDFCPTDPEKVEPGICGCSKPDTDSDSDGTPDCIQ